MTKAILPREEITLLISQSGETADTIAAQREAKLKGSKTLAICNVVGSMIAREASGTVYTHAGPEIGVASTKTFSTQLAALFLLALYMGEVRGATSREQAKQFIDELLKIPGKLEALLARDGEVEDLARQYSKSQDFLFLGRGIHYPIALEGALKLKEISYIHAEAYPAGELKHGPLALVDVRMPVVAIAPRGALLAKLKSNLQEVRARGGELFVMADEDAHIEPGPGVHVIQMPPHPAVVSPVVHAVPLQLLAYHAALCRGTDVDKPRNLAKSVTVE